VAVVLQKVTRAQLFGYQAHLLPQVALDELESFTGIQNGKIVSPV
jgi:hypothetical protein